MKEMEKAPLFPSFEDRVVPSRGHSNKVPSWKKGQDLARHGIFWILDSPFPDM
jgi:hypothetical protein